MPELPEVETTRRGIEPLVLGRRISRVSIREPRLRWRIPAALAHEVRGQRLNAVRRRAKYLLLETPAGTVILHLGMSGSVRILPSDTPPERHDHADIVFDNGRCLRLRDPRRFGALLWTREDPAQHPLLARLGPEPLGNGFTEDWLYARSRGRRIAVKSFIMNGHIVAGVGNIYASEALFKAGILPSRAAGRISRARYALLVTNVRQVLGEAIQLGGTTLRDFTDSQGNPGYFDMELQIYGRAGAPCRRCGTAIRARVIGQRMSYYCSRCQC